ncbi:hypothetical protein [Paraburkholderia fungorum]|jgi:hypothetical protein|uniref:Uncharacterized protein n=1 Tax=Paraburkholderia fungorum TaxID=134537 RepID=A0AAW3UVY7_9BURK|nr:hypothetical protein [Paraburkholderia fungorum]KFX60574.1 hypothetical protein KBK24_0137435 [Burkholderia sp. K24]MBB4514580.1 hypothetical protein [Paraburkholderia fungorum]MBB6202523.1 hypothetical protein [Paraburkholderia fungorum]MDE1011342.1 hypothetical protein [Paraburkholderia fungorum]PZR43285.1 MAG: hypothetical protein DI523_28120 [Paraburkholderia fungorum]
MRERRSRRPRPADPLARLFLEVSGEQPDDASLLRMRRVSAALNLRDNDALWSVLAVLEYYVRLYEAMPERIRQAGAGGVDAARAEAHAATLALMAQHRDALARCKETITLAEKMTAEHEARYRAALAALNDEALAVLTQRAANRIARVAGNRLVAATAVAAREQRRRLDAALASFERIAMRRFVRACYGLVAGGLAVMLLAAGAGGLAGWWAGDHQARGNGLPSARTGYTSPVPPSVRPQ